MQCLACASVDIFVSGSEDGTARHFDLRDSSQHIPGLRTGDIIGETLNLFIMAVLLACVLPGYQSLSLA